MDPNPNRALTFLRWEKRVDPKLTRSLNGMKNAGSNMIGAVYKADNFHVSVFVSV